MRLILTLVLFATFGLFGQETTNRKDTLLHIKAEKKQGFVHDYLLFIPKKTSRTKKLYLLVEPNNTGFPTDSMHIHLKHAISLAKESSIGNNISTMLNIPLLVPVFPRPNSNKNMYTHALDRDTAIDTTQTYRRLDLQLIAMIKHAQQLLKKHKVITYDKVFMNGFSASATFTNRFSMIHPELIKALAIGGFNGVLMLPKKEYNNKLINYPLGINDLSKLFNTKFDRNLFNSIPKFIYMGAIDTNDAVKFTDAYNKNERYFINNEFGPHVLTRYKKYIKSYKESGVKGAYIIYDKIGHWTTGEVNLDIIKFFFKILQK